MTPIFNDYRDFKRGDLVEMNFAHKHKYDKTDRTSGLGIVTGFTNFGWIKITWSNGTIGAWPYYKLVNLKLENK